jgi:hypothetical protein
MAEVRKGQGNVTLTREAFERRLRERFDDPAFEAVSGEVDRIVAVAWDAYDTYLKDPGRDRRDRGLSTRISSCRSSGWRHVRRSRRRNANTMTRPGSRGSC